MNVYLILTILFYGVGDLLTTYLCLQKGYTEQNPVGIWLLQHGFVYMIITKIVVITLIVGMLHLVFKNRNIFSKVIYVYVIFVGIIITINNTMLLI